MGTSTRKMINRAREIIKDRPNIDLGSDYFSNIVFSNVNIKKYFNSDFDVFSSEGISFVKKIKSEGISSITEDQLDLSDPIDVATLIQKILETIHEQSDVDVTGSSILLDSFKTAMAEQILINEYNTDKFLMSFCQNVIFLVLCEEWMEVLIEEKKANTPEEIKESLIRTSKKIVKENLSESIKKYNLGGISPKEMIQSIIEIQSNIKAW